MKILLLDAPSVIHLINQIVEDLCLGRSVLLITPFTQPLTEIRGAIASGVNRRSLWLEEFSLVDIPRTYEGCVARLSDFFRLDPTPQTLEALLLHQACPEVMLLNDIERLPQPERQIWLYLLADWTKQAKHIRDTHMQPVDRALCLCLPATALTNVPLKSDITLSIRWWWRVPSTLEMRLLCRLQSQEYTIGAIWREHLLPALIGNDLELLEYLWDTITQPVDSLIESLYQYATIKGWTEHAHKWTNMLHKQILSKANDYGYLDPPDTWRYFWDFGALCYTPEYGLEIHTAALTLLGRHEEVIQRIWRGQAVLLLPLLDNIRLSLCSHITRHYGEGWPLSWAEPKDQEEFERVKQTPLATQWGHLLQAVINSPYRDRLRKERRIIAAGREIRNELAHYRPVLYSEFSSFWESWVEFENNVLTIS